MIRETIQNVVANITETCMNEDVYVTDEESIHLPSRGAIIGIIKDLRRVVFPGYFGDENISSTMPGYFLGNMLTHIYEELKAQIEIAFLYDDKGDLRTFYQPSAVYPEDAADGCTGWF